MTASNIGRLFLEFPYRTNRWDCAHQIWWGETVIVLSGRERDMKNRSIHDAHRCQSHYDLKDRWMTQKPLGASAGAVGA